MTLRQLLIRFTVTYIAALIMLAFVVSGLNLKAGSSINTRFASTARATCRRRPADISYLSHPLKMRGWRMFSARLMGSRC